MSKIVEVPFYAESIQAVHEGEAVWVVVKRVCEALGLDPATQREKLKGKAWAVSGLIPSTAADGKTYELFCLDIESLPMWLATIDAGRVKPEARFKLVAYQKECASVLRDHFFGPRHAPDAALLAQLASAVTSLQNNLAAVWSQISTGGYIARARHEALERELYDLADLEVAFGRWKTRRAALSDIRREQGEATEWGGKGKPWRELPAAMEPAARAVLNRRRKDVMRRTPPDGGGAQLSLLKNG
jgi:hypothetical protein